MCLQQILDLCAGSSDCYISYDWNNRLKYAFIFHFFGLLWTNQFIVGLSSVVVAGAVANYYWSRGDTKRCGFGVLVRTECPVQLGGGTGQPFTHADYLALSASLAGHSTAIFSTRH